MPKHNHPDLSGPEFAYLGHFRNPKFVAQGHNELSLEELEERAKKLEEELAPTRPKPKAAAQAPAPSAPPEFTGQTMEEQIRARKKALRQLGVQ